VLLAGGEARRMGFDKRTQRLGGTTLLERNAAVLRQVFPRLAISLRADAPAGLAPAGFEVVYDETPGAPLAGIVSALAHFGEPIFVLAADMAFAERAAVKEVVEAFADVDVALPVVGGRYEPLHAVYGPGCMAPIRAMLAHGDHTIPHLYREVRLAEVPFASAALFFSLNTPTDLEEANRRLESESRVSGVRRPALVCVVGKSGSGKTTLLEALIPELRALGLRVGAVKHDAHQFDIDVPGKDSWRLGQAGAEAYLVDSPARLAFISRLAAPARLADLVVRYFAGFDIVVVEGHKLEAPYKVEIFRRDSGHDQPLCEPGEALALVTDTDIDHEQRFALDEVARLARFLAERLDQLRRY
jgi:molybdopterin-guanine dinucleotide biosynthesis protein MobB